MNSGVIESPPQKQDVELLTHIIRDCESYIDDQLKCALAADQRAINISGFLVATIIALSAGAYTLLRNEGSLLGYGVIFLIIALCTALLLALRSAVPVPFNYRGSTPENWKEDLVNCKSRGDCLEEQITHYDAMIKENTVTLDKNAQLIKRSYQIIQYALFSAVGLYVFTIVVRDIPVIFYTVPGYITLPLMGAG